MAGKNVVITGGGRGIGEKAAEVLAGQGAAIALCARTEAQVAGVADRLSRDHDVPVHAFVCDVSRPDDVAGMMADAIAALGSVDALVNNAGIPGPIAKLEAIAPEEWAETLSVNLLGTVNCCRAALPSMKAQGHGRIVNLAGAGVGWKGLAGERSAYVTSKFAVYGFSEALAREVAGDNIQVNAVSPGSVDTELRTALLAAGEQEAQAPSTGADLDPDAAARMIAFLASDDAGVLTGKILSARWDDLGL